MPLKTDPGMAIVSTLKNANAINACGSTQTHAVNRSFRWVRVTM